VSRGNPAASAAALRKTIGLFGAVSLALGIVVGAGMLSLPGLVYEVSGGWAVLAWLSNGALVLPLLFVFVALGRRFPGAGGVAGFVGQAFPALRPGSAYLLVGTFSLGLPGIALTGAEYALRGFGFAAAAGTGAWPATAIAASIIAAVTAAAWFGGRLAGGLQNLVVAVLVLSLGFVALAAAPAWTGIDFRVGAPTLSGLWSGMGLAFFAYTGWEMLSFMTEEFKNPRRDFPLAVAISFAIVVALYVGAALAVQAFVPFGETAAEAAPFLVVVGALLGGVDGAAAVVACLAVVIVVANLNGAVWAASRLVFDIGRSGWAPRRLALGTLGGKAATPRAALAAVCTLFAVVLCLHGFKVLGLADLLRVAGQNFFLLYVLAVAAFVKIDGRPARRLFGSAALVVCLVFGAGFGWSLLYAAALFAVPYVIEPWIERNRHREIVP